VTVRIVVVNPKGGSGKTTIATNLLAAYARAGRTAALIDRDRQGSAMRWLKQRAAELPPIHGIAAYQEPPPNVTRSFAMRLPPATEHVVVDTPAALDRHELLDAVRKADKIVVPVLPSAIDIHAATRCIGDLLVHGRVPRGPKVLGVVANRVKRNTVTYQALMRFLDSLGVPVVAVVRDVQAYVRAAESGRGVVDLKASEGGPELRQWRALMHWIDDDRVPQRHPHRRTEVTAPDAVADPLAQSLLQLVHLDHVKNPDERGGARQGRDSGSGGCR
jgi:chromosome partitioning protein